MISLKKETMFVYIGYILRYMSLIFLIPYYGRVLGPSSYGLVLAAMSIMNVVWMIINYGFSVTGARSIALTNSNQSRSLVFGNQITARLILLPIGVILGVICTIYSKVLSQHIWFGVLAIILGVLSAFNLGWFFQGIKKFRTSVFIEALSYPLIVIFVLLMVTDRDDGIFALLSLVLSSFICITLAYLLIKPYVTLSLSNFSNGFDEIKKSTTIFFAGVSGTVMTAGSTYLLSLFSTAPEVAYFGIAERFVGLGVALLIPLSQVLMPMIITFLGVNDINSAKRLIKKALVLEVGYGLVFSLTIFLITPFCLPFILGADFRPTVIILQTLACILPFTAISHAIGTYVLIPLHKENLLVIATAIGALLNLMIIILLFVVNEIDGLGVAIARLFGEISITLILLILLKKNKVLEVFKKIEHSK